jgi:D-alanine-D-alanine ligase-like ATP-grasp enzyme
MSGSPPVTGPGAPKILALAEASAADALADLQKARYERMARALGRAGFSFALRAVGAGESAAAAYEEEKPCLVFLSFYGREACEALARTGAPMVGSSPEALELVLSKSALKRVWGNRGVESPSSFTVRRTRTGVIAGRRLVAGAKDFPYIVKPDRENENRGIHARSIAFDADALAASIDAALEDYDELIVEHFIGGASSREFTAAMIGSGEGALILSAEILLKDRRPIRVVTREDRLRGLAEALPVSGEEGRRLEEFASRAFQASGAADYARCDIIEEGGRLYALEVNGQPRMPDPWFEACAKGGGLDADQYVAAIALASLSRNAKAGLAAFSPPQEALDLLPEPIVARLLS